MYQNSSIVTNRKLKAKVLGPGRSRKRPRKCCHLAPQDLELGYHLAESKLGSSLCAYSSLLPRVEGGQCVNLGSHRLGTTSQTNKAKGKKVDQGPVGR